MIGAEAGGILLLVLLYLLFRIQTSPLSVIQTPGALPTPTGSPSATPAPTTISVIQATAVPTATLAAAPTIAAMQQYTVQDGDTLWGIAVDFHLNLDELVAANPKINPDQLFPGDIVNVPAPGTVDVSQITRQPTAQPAQIASGLSAKVKMDTGGLRLRKGPGLDQDVITKLPDATPLNLLARTADSVWLEISLSDGSRGWVMSGYVEVSGNLSSIAIGATRRAIPFGSQR